MNRHARRALGSKPDAQGLGKAVAALGSLQEVSELVDRLRPFVAKADSLLADLATAREALAAAQAENSALRTDLTEQRQVFLRLIAQGMGISLAEVLSMEASLQGQLNTDGNANANPESDQSAGEASHPGA